jgi:hypothetical protein
MKTLTIAVVALTLGAAAITGQAASRQEQELAVCAAELKAYYGQEAQIRLIDRKRALYGTHLKVAAAVDDGNAYFANCWVDTDELAAIELDNGSEQVVAVEPASH